MTSTLPILKQRTLWWAISALAVGLGILGMGLSWRQLGAPLRPGLDFAGGTRIQVTRACPTPEATGPCATPIETGVVRTLLSAQGLEGSVIQVTGERGETVSIRSRNLSPDEETAVRQALEERIGPLDRQATQIDSVGPVIGQQLFTSGVLALLVSFAGIVAYLSIRFQFDYAVLAIVALLHDVLITMGVFAWLGLLLNVEVDSLFIVAVLTVVGFSVNDTVVIYDRIREIITPKPAAPETTPSPQTIDPMGAETDTANAPSPEPKPVPTITIGAAVEQGVRQTLSRTFNTTLTTVLPLVAIVIFGGQTLKFFALALIIGFLAGVYSSIFIASTLLVLWREKRGEGTIPLGVPSAPAPTP